MSVAVNAVAYPVALAVSPPATHTNIGFIDIEGTPCEGAGWVVNETWIGIVIRLLTTSALYTELLGYFNNENNVTFAVTPSNGGVDPFSFVGSIRGWSVQPGQKATDPVLVSFRIFITDDNP